MNTITTPTNLIGRTADRIASYFDTMYRMANISGRYRRSDFYCGITNNINSNLNRHGIEGYTACVECSSFEVSSRVEEMLGNMGFDIGNPNNPAGNGGVENSTIVYMAYKEVGFKK